MYTNTHGHTDTHRDTKHNGAQNEAYFVVCWCVCLKSFRVTQTMQSMSRERVCVCERERERERESRLSMFDTLHHIVEILSTVTTLFAQAFFFFFLINYHHAVGAVFHIPYFKI